MSMSANTIAVRKKLSTQASIKASTKVMATKPAYDSAVRRKSATCFPSIQCGERRVY